MKRYFLTALLVFSLLLPLVAIASAAPPAQEKITISFHNWMSAEKTSGGISVLLAAEEKYEKLHPEIDLDVVPLPYEETMSQLTIMTAAGEQPDITLIDVGWLRAVAAMGGIEPLNDYIPEELKDDLLPATWGEVTLEDTIWALPWNQNPNNLLYNKNLMEQAGLDPDQPPATMDELNAAIEAISGLGDDIYGIALDTSKWFLAADYLHPWLWNFGGTFLDEEGKPAFNNEAGVEMVTWLKGLVDEGYMQSGLGIRDLRVLFAQEKVGFIIEGPWIKGILQGESGRGEEFDAVWDATFIPTGPGTADSEHGFCNPSSHILVLSNKSEHKKEAVEFMEFLISDQEIVDDYMANTGLMPARQSLLTDEYRQDPKVGPFVAQMEYTRIPSGWGPKWDAVSEVYMAAIQKILIEDADIQDTLDEAVDEIEWLLEQQE